MAVHQVAYCVNGCECCKCMGIGRALMLITRLLSVSSVEGNQPRALEQSQKSETSLQLSMKRSMKRS